MRRNRVWAFIAVTVVCAAVTGAAFAGERVDPREDAFTGYKPVYFLVGLADIIDEAPQYFETNLVKLSFSVKFEFFHERKTGLYLGYTQMMFWDLFDVSSPFTEIIYNPELFWRFASGDNFLDDAVIPGVDYVQLGLEHHSTGVSGEDSRGYDQSYVRLQLGAGKAVHVHAGGTYYVYLQDFMPEWYECETPGIDEYRSNFAFELGIDFSRFSRHFPIQRATLAGGPGGGKNAFEWDKGWQQLDVEFFDIAGGVHPYVQLWNGYGESLVAYDRNVFSGRVGISLK